MGGRSGIAERPLELSGAQVGAGDSTAGISTRSIGYLRMGRGIGQAGLGAERGEHGGREGNRGTGGDGGVAERCCCPCHGHLPFRIVVVVIVVVVKACKKCIGPK